MELILTLEKNCNFVLVFCNLLYTTHQNHWPFLQTNVVQENTGNNAVINYGGFSYISLKLDCTII